ncbi:hypothetical protein CR513_01236, partial [Mucuna pruriens]
MCDASNSALGVVLSQRARASLPVHDLVDTQEDTHEAKDSQALKGPMIRGRLKITRKSASKARDA